jgi:hypothetical protein
VTRAFAFFSRRPTRPGRAGGVTRIARLFRATGTKFAQPMPGPEMRDKHELSEKSHTMLGMFLIGLVILLLAFLPSVPPVRFWKWGIDLGESLGLLLVILIALLVFHRL